MEDVQEKEQILTEKLLSSSEALMKLLVERDNLTKENEAKRQQLRSLYELLSSGGFIHPLNVRLVLRQLWLHYEKQLPLDSIDLNISSASSGDNRNNVPADGKGLENSVDIGADIAQLKSTLESLKAALKLGSVETDCPICHDPLEKGRALFTTECGHRYHYACIQSYDLQGNKPCPYCGQGLKEHPITSMVDVPSNAPWFYGLINIADASKLLSADRREGAFLVRESSTEHGKYTVSFYSQGKVNHTRVRKTLDGRYSISQLQSFATITDLIAYYGTHDYTGVDEWGSVRARFAHPVHDPAQLRTAHIQPHPGPEESPSPTSDGLAQEPIDADDTHTAGLANAPADVSPGSGQAGAQGGEELAS